VKSFQNLSQALLVSCQPPEPAHPPEVPFDHPAAWQQDEPTLHLGQLDDLQHNPVVRRHLPWSVASITLVHVGQRHGFARGLLDRRRQLGDVCPILFVGWRDVQGQQLTEGVDRKMDLAPLAAFGPVPARPRPAFWRALEGPAIQNHRAGLDRTTCSDPDQFPEIGNDGTKDIGIDPAARS